MDDTGCLLAHGNEPLDVPPPRATAAAPPADDVRSLRPRERNLLEGVRRPASGVVPQRGVRRKVLTILWDPHSEDAAPRPDVDAVRAVMHGAVASVRDYFLEVSRGQFTIEDAGVLGWYDADHAPSDYWPGGGRIGRDSGAEAIRMAARDIDLAAFDEDGDGQLRPDELAVVFMRPGRGLGGGLTRKVGADHVPRGEGKGVVVDGVRVLHVCEVSIGSPPRPGIVAHELSHLLLHLDDMYYPGFNPAAAGPYSLMDRHGWAPHLDPVHKLKLGWLTPELAPLSGSYSLPAVADTDRVLVLATADRGPDEYFLVENRWPTGRYDENLPSRGLGVWHVIEDRRTFDRHRPPVVTRATWRQVGGWTRRGIRMVRPRQGMPFSRTYPLWDGADPDLPEALLPQQRHDVHGTLRWADGSPSGFALPEIPAAGPEVEVRVERRWTPRTGTRSATGRVASLSVCDDDAYHHLGAHGVVRLEGLPNDALGVPLRAGAEADADAGMFAVLRAAAVEGHRVRVEFDEGGTALRRVVRVTRT